ncbi:hypothetical protein [Photobacterium angustum]|nr:hypothetical protein [Photobacterium angustum]
MRSITYTKRVESDRYQRSTTVYSLPERSIYSGELEIAQTSEYRNFNIEIMDNIQYGYVNINNSKYWNWDDMKKVIELAGTIE